ncbi:hypothetical protein ABZZ74_44845 [Streptomyces sp. NPDC006476]|uniref:hypothetical protein n=1 Tax=Streptomyces sp. NPDC006476 TaxID=3157175 RepID=UPI0033B85DB1
MRSGRSWSLCSLLGRSPDGYLIRGVLATAVKHTVNTLAVLRDAFTGTTWLPPAALA